MGAECGDGEVAGDGDVCGAPLTIMQSIPLPARLMAAGGLAGTVTKTATAPLDRIKVLLQVQAMNKAVDGKYVGIVGSTRMILQEEGMRAMWRGNWANCARIVPVYASRFAFNDLIRAQIVEPGQDLKKLRFTQSVMAGSLAGLAQQVLCYPFETVRTRLSLGGAATGLGQSYNGIFDCFVKTVRIEGVTAIYKGLTASCLYGAPYVGLNMSLNEAGKNLLSGGDPSSLQIHHKLLCGSFGATAAQTIVFPFDTLRRRLQANGEGGALRQYSGLLDCAAQTLRKEGVPGFYRGVWANCVRMVPTGAIQHVAYGYFKQRMDCD
jgi:solute carrier family 25 phosphate transporter 23/24/25/41